MRNAYGNVTAPMNGYIWDACTRAGVSVRSYGEFTELAEAPRARTPARAAGRGEGARPRSATSIRPTRRGTSSSRTTSAWTSGSRSSGSSSGTAGCRGSNIIRLGGDHTAGTRAGYPTPRAMIAENDPALGRIVEAISHSVYWKESAIFVLEDDAQNGPDHVDAHRSPRVRDQPVRQARPVDSTLYTTSAMLRTMELILGLPPMSNLDAAATPMYNAFQATPVLTPFTARPARHRRDREERRRRLGRGGVGADEHGRGGPAPDLELNEIVWRSVRGAGSPMPPPVRAAFIRALPADDGDGDGDDRPDARDRR